ncbi:adenosylcobinamide-GDP ribazoletransferase [Paenibacillus sp. V4I3]|uniref:adenosylcobinamide-GDP ribazoletransferase n=1 Tax=unclassified Paenibacillus TaxID=185978 RepID=UPI00278B03B5|nr:MULTISPECIES: adenosylcobinamide-GDP ribazoletransferase [unclassified Paenibacillus]MDQ0873454.1 adenosylcobinamide-GDP ribazoletransferase [Paenibacillus sp. V4I3]MDQ0890614.1 adenosylcobinamide-GDP ribazoletransferase [Paenibacillus sp. V4I9]
MHTTRTVLLDWLRACIAAFQFLTRLPIPVQIDYTDRVFRRSVIFYPLAGFVIGLLLLLAGEGLSLVLPAMPAAVLLLGFWVVLTGGLHLDGLMDTADGILSHRPREQMLEIMKDSRVGAMGVIVCVLHLLLKFSLLYTLLGTGGMGSVCFLLAIVPIWSRWFMVAAIYGWPYARRDSGLGSFFRGVTKWHVTMSGIVALFTTTLFVTMFSTWLDSSVISFSLFYGLTIIFSFAIGTILIGWLLATYISRKLGGLTGDTYGALNELLETLLLLGITIFVTAL